MLADDVKVTKQTQDAKFNADGTFTPQIRIEFTVGKHGPFSLRLPVEGFTRMGADDAINRMAAEIRVP